MFAAMTGLAAYNLCARLPRVPNTPRGRGDRIPLSILSWFGRGNDIPVLQSEAGMHNAGVLPIAAENSPPRCVP